MIGLPLSIFKLTMNLDEVIGYMLRIYAHYYTAQLAPFILQSVFILLGPALFAASIYMTLGRLIRFLHAEHLSPVRVNWMTKAFLVGDALSFTIQGNSAGLTFRPATKKLGEGLVVAGLFVQIVSFGLFFITSVVFHSRIRRSPTAESSSSGQEWVKVLWMLYAVSVLILLRSCFRVIEYLMGYEGYLFVHEWTLYVFDALPMWLACGAFWWYWPSEIRVEKEDDAIQLQSQVRDSFRREN